MSEGRFVLTLSFASGPESNQSTHSAKLVLCVMRLNAVDVPTPSIPGAPKATSECAAIERIPCDDS